MATFKVGQRVKKIAFRRTPSPNPVTHMPIGSEGAIVAVDLDDDRSPYCIHWDAGLESWVAPYMIAPLTDPRESEWASQAVRDLLRKVKEPIELEGETVMGEK